MSGSKCERSTALTLDADKSLSSDSAVTPISSRDGHAGVGRNFRARYSEGPAEDRREPLKLGVAVAVEQADDLATDQMNVQFPGRVGPIERGAAGADIYATALQGVA